MDTVISKEISSWIDFSRRLIREEYKSKNRHERFMRRFDWWDRQFANLEERNEDRGFEEDYTSFEAEEDDLEARSFYAIMAKRSAYAAAIRGE